MIFELWILSLYLRKESTKSSDYDSDSIKHRRQELKGMDMVVCEEII